MGAFEGNVEPGKERMNVWGSVVSLAAKGTAGDLTVVAGGLQGKARLKCEIVLFCCKKINVL